MSTASAEEILRRLTIGESRLLSAVVGSGGATLPRSGLDLRTEQLLRIAALIALDAPESSYRGTVDEAQRAGASIDDLVAVLVAVAAQVGSARVTSAAPKIAIAAGYDVEADLDRFGPDEGSDSRH
jgi:alkylhydroperoxidase/carboxymuconolactone decarboxylase family protein YurZ